MAQPETYLKIKVMDALKKHYGRDIFFFKVHGSEYMMDGLPDIICCYRGLFIGLELKVGTNQPTLKQLHRRKQILRAGGYSVIARSVDEAIAVVEKAKTRYASSR